MFGLSKARERSEAVELACSHMTLEQAGEVFLQEAAKCLVFFAAPGRARDMEAINRSFELALACAGRAAVLRGDEGGSPFRFDFRPILMQHLTRQAEASRADLQYQPAYAVRIVGRMPLFKGVFLEPVEPRPEPPIGPSCGRLKTPH